MQGNRKMRHAIRTRTTVLGAIAGLLLAGLGLVVLDPVREGLRSVTALKEAYFWAQNLFHPAIGLAERGDGGPKEAILLLNPMGLDEDREGNLFIGERGLSDLEGKGRGGRVIWKIDGRGRAQVIAGTGRRGPSRASVPALESNLGSVEGLRVDGAGRIYFADPWNHVILRVERDGMLTLVAGTGRSGFNGDGVPAVEADLNEPYDVALDLRGNVYIADYGNHRIRMVDTDGMIHTIAGTGAPGYDGDSGPATQARLRGPYNVQAGPEDRIYIADSLNHVIRRVDHDGTITTVAGVGQPGYAGDGGPARSARLDTPQALAFDGLGRLIISDEHNHALRIVGSDGRISTLVGTGRAGYAEEGTPIAEAPLNDPEFMLVRQDGSILICDRRNSRVLELADDGLVRSFAGRGEEDLTARFR